jgi:putative hydrolases of HD superfamily
MNRKKFSIDKILNFIDHFYKLKEIDRTGWKTKLHLKNSESVAEHTLSMIVLVMLFADYNNYTISKTIKMIKMTLIHDLGESIIGDFIPETIENEKKKKLENVAMQNILLKIPWKPIKRKYIKIWNEFNDNKTETSKLIHFFDKIEMVIQATYYQKNNKNINKTDIVPFFDSALKYIKEIYNDKNNKKNTRGGERKDIDEIEQILLYLNK